MYIVFVYVLWPWSTKLNCKGQWRTLTHAFSALFIFPKPTKNQFLAWGIKVHPLPPFYYYTCRWLGIEQRHLHVLTFLHHSLIFWYTCIISYFPSDYIMRIQHQFLSVFMEGNSADGNLLKILISLSFLSNIISQLLWKHVWTWLRFFSLLPFVKIKCTHTWKSFIYNSEHRNSWNRIRSHEYLTHARAN